MFKEILPIFIFLPEKSPKIIPASDPKHATKINKNQKNKKIKKSSKIIVLSEMTVTMGRIAKNRFVCPGSCRFSSHGDPFHEHFCVFYGFWQRWEATGIPPERRTRT